jgi:hypothetical protein
MPRELLLLAPVVVLAGARVALARSVQRLAQVVRCLVVIETYGNADRPVPRRRLTADRGDRRR